MVRWGALAIPEGAMRLIARTNSVVCLAMGTVATINTAGPQRAGTFVLHGTPAMQLRYFAVWSQTPP